MMIDEVDLLQRRIRNTLVALLLLFPQAITLDSLKEE